MPAGIPRDGAQRRGNNYIATRPLQRAIGVLTLPPNQFSKGVVHVQ